MKNNTLKILLAAMIMVATTTAKAYDFKAGGLCYNILSEEEHTVEVTYEFNNSAENEDYVNGDLVIPSKTVIFSNKYIIYTVTAIAPYAFQGCTGLTSVEIPNSVTSISSYTFSECSGLTSVTIPNSVTSISTDAFYGCRGLTSVTIPNSVTTISSGAFYYCRRLTEINVDTENPEYSSESGILYSRDKTTLLTCPEGKKGEIVIPSTVNTIESSAFSGCFGLTSVTIPNSVTSIRSYAFMGCNGLTSVMIPNSVTEIDDNAFVGCNGLTSVMIPNSVTSISSGVFAGCYDLTSVEIPNSVTSICSYAFSKCWSLRCVTIPNSVTEIGDHAFNECEGLWSVEIPNSVTEIGSGAFSKCRSLRSVTIPNSVTEIGSGAFEGCAFESVYCQWTKPIECDPGFAYYDYMVLYVPKGCTAAYEMVAPWKYFSNIEEIDYSAGVEDVAGDGVEVKVVDGAVVAEGCAEMEVYSMSGQLVYRGAGRADNFAPGIYAVRAAGKTVKVMVR